MRTGFLLNETLRLETLRGYGILDTPPDAVFDDLARLAARICDAPVALVSIVDGERHWFKSRVGFERRELPRDAFFCAVAVDRRELLIVTDTLADARFAEWPISQTYRFYAGLPLLAPNGSALGTLCLLDEEPRDFDVAQASALRVLAQQVMAQLELHRQRSAIHHVETDHNAQMQELSRQLEREIAARQHYEQELRYQVSLFENVSDAVMSMDLDSTVRTWNAAARATYGFGADEVIGEKLDQFITTSYIDTSDEEVAERLAEEGFWFGRAQQHTRAGRDLYVLCSISQIRDGENEIIGLVTVNRDITDQYQAERALFEREQQFRRLAEGLPEYIYILDLDQMQTLFANRDSFLGYSNREWRDLSLIDKVHPRDRHAVRSYFDNFVTRLAEGQQPEISYRFKDSADEWVWLQQRGLVFSQDGDRVTQAMITLENVSEARRLEQEIQESLEKRSRQVAVIGQIGRDIATAEDLESLFGRLVHAVKESFDYSHVQILRYDPALDEVTLVYGYGQVGREMMAMNYSLPMDIGLIGRAAASGESQLRPELRMDELDWQPHALLTQTRSELAVPIKLGDEVLGVLDVHSDTPNRLGDEDRLLMESLCNQIAIAVESTRLRLELESQVSEMSHLQRLMSREGWRAFQSTQYGETLGYAFNLASVERLSATPRGAGAPTDGGAERGVTMRRRPLSVRGEIIGQIGVAEDPNRPLAPADRALLEAISEQVSEALETARLLEQTQKRAVELETVAQVSAATATNLDQKQLLQEVVDLTKFSFDLYHVHIYLVEPGGRQLVLAAGAGEVGRQMVADGWRIPLDHRRSIVARAARERQGVMVHDVRQEVGYLPNPLLPETRSELAVPMIVGQELLGVLDVQSAQVHAFTPDDDRIQSSLAVQVAVALQNAGRYQEQSLTADKLREVDRLKSEFLASMSHELRTPLNSIIGFADVLLEGLDGELAPRMEEDVRLIRNSGDHLRNLIGDILDMSKIEAGKMVLNFEMLDVEAVVREVVANAEKLARTYDREHLTLEVNVDANVPPVEADRTRLIQILYNLVSNAIKFTSEGGVTISLRHDENDLLMEVSDSGIGIDSADADLIFEQFRQVDGSMTRRSGGTGLGLPITRHLVAMHGGEIWVESEADQGSTFFVRLPLRQSETADEPQ